MKLSDFMYDLPEERIAQTPAEPRDHSRLMVVHRDSHELEHRHFYDVIDSSGISRYYWTGPEKEERKVRRWL